MNYDHQWVDSVKKQLLSTGIAICEQFGLGTMPFERDSGNLINDLRALGLKGVIDTGAYNRHEGDGSTFYWISYGVDYGKAKRLAEVWAQKNPD